MPRFLHSCPNTGLVSDVLVHGMKARNRSIHGDVVVVELLPKTEWKGRTAALCENDSDDKASGDPPSEPMPTGEPTGWCPSYPLFLRNIYHARLTTVITVQCSFFSPNVSCPSPQIYFILQHPNMLCCLLEQNKTKNPLKFLIPSSTTLFSASVYGETP